jgi:hypothetical protein
MCLTVFVEHRSVWVVAHACGAHFVNDSSGCRESVVGFWSGFRAQ